MNILLEKKESQMNGGIYVKYTPPIVRANLTNTNLTSKFFIKKMYKKLDLYFG